MSILGQIGGGEGGGLDYKLIPKIGRESHDGELSQSYTKRMEKFEQQTEQMMYSGMFIRCAKHNMGGITFTCPHCKEQDPVRPQGMIRTPFGYYLCTWCYGKYRTESLDLPHVLESCCGLCLMDELLRVRAIDPKRAIDMFQGKDAKRPNHGIFK
ncbi:MAG: hypothetical protein GZ088_16050 [Acidipila sp.]|nr:hypothetical protein [Acidipila sp.]